MENRIWKEHPIYKNIYCSPDGWVWNRRNEGKGGIQGKPTIGNDNGHGYLIVSFRENGKQIVRNVHRLVAETFIPIPEELKQYPKLDVNHKNEDKTDNRVENLEWCTAEYNINYGTRNERIAKALTNRPDQSKPIIGINKETGEVVEFPSVMETERQLGISNQNICNCLKGRQKSSGGYYWYYKRVLL